MLRSWEDGKSQQTNKLNGVWFFYFLLFSSVLASMFTLIFSALLFAQCLGVVLPNLLVVEKFLQFSQAQTA